MSARARRAAVLALLAAVLLANPLYVDALVVRDTGSASGATYSAVAVDPDDAGDRETLVRAVGDDDVVAVDDLADADEYHAPERAATALERAIENGSASTNDDDTAFTLRRVAANHRYAVTESEMGAYYRIDAERTETGTTVTAASVSTSTVADYLVHRDAVLYTSFSEERQHGIDEAIASGDAGYLSDESENLGTLTDDVVVRGDTYYVVRTVGVHDDFSAPVPGAASTLFSAFGAIAFVAATVLTARSYWAAHGN